MAGGCSQPLAAVDVARTNDHLETEFVQRPQHQCDTFRGRAALELGNPIAVAVGQFSELLLGKALLAAPIAQQLTDVFAAAHGHLDLYRSAVVASARVAAFAWRAR